MFQNCIFERETERETEKQRDREREREIGSKWGGRVKGPLNLVYTRCQNDTRQ